MNKKYLMFGMLGLFAMALVSAGLISYYGQIEQNVNVEQAVSLDCPDNNCYEDLSGVIIHTGDSFVSDVYTVTNNAGSSRDVKLTTTYPTGDEDEVTTSYFGVLELVQKNTNTWEPIENGITATIQYTIVGDEFVVSGIPEGYTLVYYPNTVHTETSYLVDMENTIVLSEGVNDIQSLPLDIDVGDDYCNILNNVGDLSNPNAKFCSGAKLWLIPGDTGDINWNVMDTFLFETDLITYTNADDGIVTLLSNGGFDFVVVNEINEFSDGVDGLITTDVTIV